MLFVYQDSDAAIVLANIAPQMPKRTVRNDGTEFAKCLSEPAAPQRSQKTQRPNKRESTWAERETDGLVSGQKKG